jgi:hypothetical protein
MNKAFYPIKIRFGSELIELSFRKKESIFILQSLLDNLDYYYDEQFTISYGQPGKSYLGNSFPNKRQQIKIKERSSIIVQNRLDLVEGHKVVENEFYNNYFYCIINLPPKNTITKVFEGNHICTIQELEKLNGFQVKPIGVVSKFEFGGFVVYEEVTYNLGIQINKTNKQLIDSVFINGPGYISGLVAGDIILKVNNIELSESNYMDLFKGTHKDISSNFQIKRNDEILSIDILPQKKLNKLIVYPFTYGQMFKDQAVNTIDNLSFGSYSDWKLPNYIQMEFIHKRIMSYGYGNLLSYDRLYNSDGEMYWCLSNDKFTGLLVDRQNSNSHVINGRKEIQDVDSWGGFFIPIRVQEVVLN